MGDISHAFIDWPTLLNSSNPSLFFGVGLCTSREPAVALPFDILSFFFIAEKLWRELSLDTIFVLIADEHALTNSFMTDKLVQKLRQKMKLTFTTLIRNLQLRHFQIITSSEMHNDKEFQKIFTSLPNIQNQYLHQELADMVWFTQTNNVRIKLGWSINNDSLPQGHDERFFDAEIKRVSPNLPLLFLHCKAGKTFDPKRPKTSPYIAIANEPRILLRPDENALEKIAAAKVTCNPELFRGTMSHLGLIVRLFESVFIQIPKERTEDKIQFIIDLATHI